MYMVKVMKVKHIWSVLCKESLINQDDNVISLNGILEELTITLSSTDKGLRLPDKFNIPLNFEIVSFWIKNQKSDVIKAEIEYTLINPEGLELLKTVQSMEIPASASRSRSRMKIIGISITTEGDYSFRIKIKETKEDNFILVSELPLEVKIALINSSKVN